MDRSLLSRRFVSFGYHYTGVIALISTSFVQVSLPALGNMLFINEKKNEKKKQQKDDTFYELHGGC